MLLPSALQHPWAGAPAVRQLRRCVRPGCCRLSMVIDRNPASRARALLPGRPGQGRTRPRSTFTRCWSTWALRPRPRYCCPGCLCVCVLVLQEHWGMQALPQLQVPAPHLRVVSRRERGKKLPYPAAPGWKLSHTSGRSRCRSIWDTLGGLPACFVSAG